MTRSASQTVQSGARTVEARPPEGSSFHTDDHDPAGVTVMIEPSQGLLSNRMGELIATAGVGPFHATAAGQECYA
jgi:hypothetical protein